MRKTILRRTRESVSPGILHQERRKKETQGQQIVNIRKNMLTPMTE